MSTAGNPPAAGTVKVRLSGGRPGLAAALRLLHDAAQAEGIETESFDAPRLYPNRREPGYRVYVTLRFPGHGTSTELRRAAHSHQAIRRPAVPSRRHRP